MFFPPRRRSTRSRASSSPRDSFHSAAERPSLIIDGHTDTDGELSLTDDGANSVFESEAEIDRTTGTTTPATSTVSLASSLPVPRVDRRAEFLKRKALIAHRIVQHEVAERSRVMGPQLQASFLHRLAILLGLSIIACTLFTCVGLV